MPITITPLTSPASFGYGVTVSTDSSFIGPIQTGSHLELGLFTDADFTENISVWSVPADGQQSVFQLVTNAGTFGSGVWSVPAGSQVHARARLRDPVGQVLDSGTVALPWQDNAQEPITISRQIQSGTGLSPIQAQQLEETHVSVFPAINLDELLAPEISPGPTPGPVTAALPIWTFGVIVRITSIDPALQPQTPDGVYFVPTLASILLFRGQDIWMRVPVHTPSKIVPFVGEGLLAAITDATVGAWLFDMSVQVFFREGCTGQVFLMRTP